MWCFMIVVWSGLVELVTWLSTVSRIYRYARIKYKNWIRFTKIELTGAFVVCLTWSWTLWLSFALTSWFTLTWFCHSSLPDSYCHNRHVSQNLIYNHDCHFTLSDRRAAANIFGFDTFSRCWKRSEHDCWDPRSRKRATPQLAYHFDPATAVPSTFFDPGGRELE